MGEKIRESSSNSENYPFKVVIVDSDEVMLNNLKSLLLNFGYDVTKTQPSTKEVVDMLQEDGNSIDENESRKYTYAKRRAKEVHHMPENNSITMTKRKYSHKSDSSGNKKQRMSWTKELTNKLLESVYHLENQGQNATPTRVMEYMNVPGLDQYHISSKMQKLRKKAAENWEQVVQEELNSVENSERSQPEIPLEEKTNINQMNNIRRQPLESAIGNPNSRMEASRLELESQQSRQENGVHSTRTHYYHGLHESNMQRVFVENSSIREVGVMRGNYLEDALINHAASPNIMNTVTPYTNHRYGSWPGAMGGPPRMGREHIRDVSANNYVDDAALYYREQQPNYYHNNNNNNFNQAAR